MARAESMIGKSLLHYVVTARIGSGGMGEVYRATDTKLGREVAIKVLPSDVAENEERLARFRREARVLAALNHPGIASIYGLEEADGRSFLVMELASGEDLQKRLERGPIPVDEAVEIAKQIADALKEAHERGFVHRDLKPANIKLDPEGEVKILDFGLARGWGGDGGSANPDLSSSPTDAFTGTSAGVILGTAAYMSPEQASGRTVDKRSDIWSFGVVLFEMLTGERLFHGEAASETLASVIKEEPDWERLPKECPASARQVLRRCLRKKPRERLQDAGDIRVLLDGWAAAQRDDEVLAARPGSQVSWRRLVAAALVVGAASGVVGSVVYERIRPRQRPPPVVRLVVDLPPRVNPTLACLSVSPDGRFVALVPPGLSVSDWIVPLDGAPPREILANTGDCPFWSPDSKRVGFVESTGGRHELRARAVDGGAVETLATIDGPEQSFRGADWRAGTIVVGVGGSLYQVPTTGGEPTVLLRPDPGRGEAWLGAPQLLPDGRGLLYSVGLAEGVERWLADLDRPEAGRRILSGVGWSAYHGSGNMLYARDGTLLAQPFDADAGELHGSPVSLGPVAMSVRGGRFHVSDSGVLAYIEGGDERTVLSWFDRRGSPLGTLGGAELYLELRLSPDDRQVAVTIQERERGQGVLWLVDVGRGVATTAVPGDESAGAPLWSADGRVLYYQSTMDDGITRPHSRSLHSGTSSTLLVQSAKSLYPEDVSPDGAGLLVLGGFPPKPDELSLLPLAGGGELELLVEVDHWLDGAEVSPDGRWLAYISNETGEWEVYIAPFRRQGRPVRVSTAGGRQPQWRGDSRELYYVTESGELMAVELAELGGELGIDPPERLFTAGVNSITHDHYGVTRDGQRFLVMTPAEGSRGRLKVLLNWTSLLD